MSFPMSPARLAVAALLLLGLMPLALPVSAEEAVSRRSLITAKVDERQLVTLEGNTRPEVAVAQSHQAVEDALPLQHMHLQLRRSAAQEQAVAAFIDSLTDKSSPNFHHWLTATDFGQRFGVPQADIDKVSAWLRAKGMTVNFVYPSRMVIDFSGTAGQVKAAFHTEIHRLNVDGVDHIANVSDPQIPAALAPAVQGVVSLHDFRARNKLVHKPKVTGGCQGQTCWDVGPGDLQTIYGITSLYNAGYTGKGEVIAVVEDTNLYQYSDWSTFRGVFGLTKYSTGNLQVVQPAAKGKTACQNPGVVSGNDGEATLDAEWASAAAPGATILLASCADTATTDGVYLAAQNLVNGANPPPVISISYGICEVQDGQAENAAFSSLYQMAAALGISVFVATGDNGPTDCAPNGNGTTAGIGVNGWATSAYNVAVGGTDFLDTYAGTNAAYWKANAGGTYSTAKSYVPEFTWNDTCASPQVGFYWDGDATPYGASGFCNSHEGSTFLALGGGEGGPSSCFKGRPSIPNVVSGTCQGNPKPIWQAGVIGIPVDHLRDVPDVSLFASDGSVWSHNYATCFTDRANGGGPCTGNPVTWAANAGGTSYATPIMAAIQALVDQFNRGRQGNVVQKYYQLAAAEYGKSGNSTCSASLGNKIGAGCIFHDIVSGTTDMPCRGTYNCYRPSGRWGVLSTTNSAYRPAYNAGIGYDLATGIGSVNAYNLATKW
jgi:subtilase family serine protease